MRLSHEEHPDSWAEVETGLRSRSLYCDTRSPVSASCSLHGAMGKDTEGITK